MFDDVSVWNKGRGEINKMVAAFAAKETSVSEKEILDLLDYDAGPDGSLRNNGNKLAFQIKQCIKYARKAGVHVSPTVLWNGIEDPNVGSSFTGEQWMAWLAKKSAESKL